jgi:hypothetical protein
MEQRSGEMSVRKILAALVFMAGCVEGPEPEVECGAVEQHEPDRQETSQMAPERECVDVGGGITCVSGGPFAPEDFAAITLKALDLWAEWSGDDADYSACLRVDHVVSEEAAALCGPTAAGCAHPQPMLGYDDGGTFYGIYAPDRINAFLISHEIWHMLLWCAGFAGHHEHHQMEGVYPTQEQLATRDRSYLVARSASEAGFTW